MIIPIVPIFSDRRVVRLISTSRLWHDARLEALGDIVLVQVEPDEDWTDEGSNR